MKFLKFSQHVTLRKILENKKRKLKKLTLINLKMTIRKQVTVTLEKTWCRNNQLKSPMEESPGTQMPK